MQYSAESGMTNDFRGGRIRIQKLIINEKKLVRLYEIMYNMQLFLNAHKLLEKMEGLMLAEKTTLPSCSAAATFWLGQTAEDPDVRNARNMYVELFRIP